MTREHASQRVAAVYMDHVGLLLLLLLLLLPWQSGQLLLLLQLHPGKLLRLVNPLYGEPSRVQCVVPIHVVVQRVEISGGPEL
jgi:hypothetical protein